MNLFKLGPEHLCHHSQTGQTLPACKTLQESSHEQGCSVCVASSSARALYVYTGTCVCSCCCNASSERICSVAKYRRVLGRSTQKQATAMVECEQCTSVLSDVEASYGTRLCDKCYNLLCSMHIKTTSREVHVYRWGPLYDHVNDANKAQPSLWDVPVSIHDDRVAQFVHHLKEEFWQPWKGHSGCREGLGVYVATDAASTRKFGGGGEWCLIQFRMPAGTRYLDVNSMDGSWRRYCQFASSSTSEQEKKIKLFQAAGIQALLYSHSASNFKCMPMRTQCAFVLVDDRAINFGTASVFTQLQPHDEPCGEYQNRLLIQEMFHQAGETNIPWPNLGSHKPEANFKSWAEDNLFN